MNKAVIWNCTEKEYNEEMEHVRSSGLKIARRSPAEYRDTYVTKIIGNTTTRAKMLGSVTHCLAIEGEDVFASRYAVRPPGVKGTDGPGRAKLKEWKLASVGKVVLEDVVTNVDDFLGKARGMVKALQEDDFLQGLISSAKRETALVWIDDETGLPCKLRTDLWIERPDRPTDLILDIKTSDDPTPENWQRGGAFCPIVKYGYDLSGAHYVDGWRRYTGRQCEYGLIVVGSDVPHDVFCYDVTDWLQLGEEKRRVALQRVEDGLKRGCWKRPCQSGILKLRPSKWDVEDKDE